MKIVHLNLSGPYDIGWGYQENLISKYHKLSGNDVIIITTPFITDLKTGNFVFTNIKEEYDNEVKVIRLENELPQKINLIFRKFKGLYKILDKEKPDFIFVHGTQFLDAKTLCKYLKKNPSVLCCVDNHADFSNSAKTKLSLLLHKTLWKIIANKLNRCVDVFFGVLPARCDFLIDVYDLPKEKIELLVMGADDKKVEIAKQNKLLTRKELGIDDDFVIITGGKIDEYKTETLDLLDSINELNNNKIRLIVFGSVVDSLKEKFNQSLRDNIYLGWLNQEDIYKYLCCSDLGIFPGRHSVVWEQITGCGIPAIYKDWDKTHHIDIGGNCKFLTNPSKESIKKAITELLNNTDEYEKMLIAAKSTRKDVFLYSNIAKNSIEITRKYHEEKQKT